GARAAARSRARRQALRVPTRRLLAGDGHAARQELPGRSVGQGQPALEEVVMASHARAGHESLRVIGAGFSRTGTFSLRQALIQLGLGPCHHMHEVFEHPEQHALWRAAAAGQLGDWQTLLGSYRSVTDAPACLFWRELVARYPQAQVILTLRDAGD